MNRLRSRWFKRAALAAAAAAATVLAVGLVLVSGYLLLSGVDTNHSQRVAGGGTQMVSVSLTEFDVDPGTLVVDSGTHLVFDVTNYGKQTHDLAVEGGVHSKKLGVAQSQRLDLGLISEGVRMSCTQSLHEFLGMKLHIRVVSPGQGLSDE